MEGDTPRAMRAPLPLRHVTSGGLALWCLVAAFPLFWIAVMSFKLPIDAFSENPLAVILGPVTLAAGKGLSMADIAVGLLALAVLYVAAAEVLDRVVRAVSAVIPTPLGWVLFSALYAVGAVAVLAFALPAVVGPIKTARRGGADAADHRPHRRGITRTSGSGRRSIATLSTR